ncbi:MAG: exodeoxyribonuclease VII large subunit [gamma proteobacterium symbiont of Bathyaustriella thionipta]|nr:exodeoxyribonuclease VII large subunit [gamma proteobacterium symbiont of Bathyaustriella thionipta]MCU7950192.1 exodeoxyribonuclease VII large subunit [gamma proteobacterium symbiont of Bathyaustriella thionipta]MCU7954925.1 exodeoxyribonuclease VII large subunit [gamma proteobacterium symbiont of Bathyaustriella thionipta]MCU7967187.1 exodeoxyribonuclease VII large subunit [gamma proteobacterium symbiont of Bathyaustriella thionipta]
MTMINDPNVLSVSEFSRNVKRVLEYNFPAVWISGEISNLAMPRSGHWYFTLKDDQSQVRCAMFRQSNQRLNFVPDEGMQIVIKARVSLYEARGDFQLIVDSMEDAGAGALQRAFEQLKQTLQTQGIFDSEHKKPLPEIPRCVGIITSPTGAALHDILNVLKRRFPALPVIIYPAQVQGNDAPEQLLHALHQAQEQALCDVLIIGRGGGSIEDLWAFNNEQLALAIYACQIPVISSVGHEVDFTICDFVADVRAATPSAAAELASPDQDEWLNWLQGVEKQLGNLIERYLSSLQQRLQWQYKQLKHPGRYLDEVAQRIDELSARMEQRVHFQLQLRQEQSLTLEARLQQHSPMHQLTQQQTRLNYLQQRLKQSLIPYFEHTQQQIASLAREMDAFSPLATLGRGYSLVKDEQGKLIKSATQLTDDQQVTVHFAHDQALMTVNKK